MPGETLILNRAVVCGFGALYWAGVWVQARRIRRRIGRSANTRPRGAKERWLWVGWCFVVLGWLCLPFLSAPKSALPGTGIIPSLVHPANLVLGLAAMCAGYAGTLWCYVSMGSAWRMGIDRGKPAELVTRGPYGLVRHPIYLFQVFMVAAIPILLPSVFALAILGVHLLCVLTKAVDEEAYLRATLGPPYEAYCNRAGRWFPRLRKPEPTAPSGPAADGKTRNASDQPLK
jgi:protein-S-isoprenylcysteine O-methyltransferase Ste14